MEWHKNRFYGIILSILNYFSSIINSVLDKRIPPDCLFMRQKRIHKETIFVFKQAYQYNRWIKIRILFKC